MQAKLNYLHIAPRKVRLIADLVRGKTVEKAQMILNFADKRSSAPVLQLLNSAVANAKNNFQMEDIANLYISKILVNEGPKHKRWRPASRGRANEIRKRTSHVILELDEIEKKDTVAKNKIKAKKQGEAEKAKAETGEEKKAPLKAKEHAIKPKFEKQKPEPARALKRVFRRKAF